jgi:ATP-dependent RNA helicase DHX8/PRP22
MVLCRCVSEVVSISAMLATEHVFSAGQGPGDVLRGVNKRHRGGDAGGGVPTTSGRGEGPKERLRELVRRDEGDHVLLLRLWEAWRDRG